MEGQLLKLFLLFTDFKLLYSDYQVHTLLGHCLFRSVCFQHQISTSAAQTLFLSPSPHPILTAFYNHFPDYCQIATTARVIFVVLFRYVLNCASNSNPPRVHLLITRPSFLLYHTKMTPLGICLMFWKGEQGTVYVDSEGLFFFFFFNVWLVFMSPFRKLWSFFMDHLTEAVKLVQYLSLPYHKREVGSSGCE